MPPTDRAHIRLVWPEPKEGSASEQKAPLLVIVSGDPAVVGALDVPLTDAGHVVTAASSGRAALEAFRGRPAPALVILDLSLPDMDPTEFFAEARGQQALGSVPIIVLTRKNTEAERIVAFELGADDLVSTPFSVREVLLRIRVQLRRKFASTNGPGVLEIGALRLDQQSHRVWMGNRLVPLSVREFRLLQVLMERSERVLSRRLLLDLAWGTNANVGARAVDAYITRLRRKLEDGRDYVETVSSVGYRLKRPPTR